MAPYLRLAPALGHGCQRILQLLHERRHALAVRREIGVRAVDRGLEDGYRGALQESGNGAVVSGEGHNLS